MLQEYIDIEIRLDDLDKGYVIPARVLPDISVRELIRAIAAEFASELDRSNKTEEVQPPPPYTLWWENGISALPMHLTMQELHIGRRARLVFGIYPPKIPDRDWKPEFQAKLESSEPQVLDPGVALIELQNSTHLDWRKVPSVVGRSGDGATRFQRVALDQFINAQYVSKEHLLIFKREQTYYAVDLGRNGKHINEEKLTPITRAYPLQNNDEIHLGDKTLGNVVTLIFRRP